jgi:hypothetical protein
MKKKTAAKKTSRKKTTAKKITAKKITPKGTATKAAAMPDVKGLRTKNLDIYGSAPLAWSRALKQLEANSGTYWLATTNPDGRPHVVAIGALWIDGKIYFTSGTRTRKGRNLAARRDCVFSISLPDIDVVIEGAAIRITDRPTLMRLAKRYADQGWPATVSGDAFIAEYSAPSAGPPPWNLYVLRPSTAFGVATAEPHGATRWQFESTRE